MEKRFKKIAIMILGTLTALVVVFSQLFYFELSDFNKKQNKANAKTESKDQDQEDQANSDKFFAMPSSSVLTTLQVDLNFDIYFLFEILFQDQHESSVENDQPTSLGKYFLTLFPLIISPNAP